MKTLIEKLKLAILGEPQLNFAECVGKLALIERTRRIGLLSCRTKQFEAYILRVAKDGAFVKLGSGSEQWWEDAADLEIIEIPSPKEPS